ncbi:glycosyltransferase family 2 protein [Thioclava sp. FR2]|uniref:glycosyltransferase family 2 protein n=1 Tax=Thioclava sp. FR2 TaxID=3445780 RepID=UPI003EBA82FD
MRFCVVCSVRNEGAFLVEWITWYRMLGFDDIVVVTNDCTDHSMQMLDLLQEKGWITHLRHEVEDGVQITSKKLLAAKDLPQVREADWVLVCDVDEFLVIHKGQGKITDLIPQDADFLGMSINWKVFGTSGNETYEDGLVHRQFTLSAPSEDPTSTWVKSIHSHADWFRKLGEHGPKRLIPKHSKRWGQPGMRWVDASGKTLHDWHPDSEYLRRVHPERQDHSAAQMNHYMVRSEESYGLKKGSLSPVAGKDRYTDAFFERYNKNEIKDLSAFRYEAEFDRLYAEAVAIPGLAALHHQCCADYLGRIAAKSDRRAEDDPRYLAHLERVAALGGLPG